MAKEFKSGVLRLEVTKDTAGLYRCSATNPMGSIERTVSVGYLSKYTGSSAGLNIKWTLSTGGKGKECDAFC